MNILLVPFMFIKLLWTAKRYNGDYNPDDPDDSKLIRFDVFIKDSDGEWTAVDDASYCTTLQITLPMRDLERKITTVFKEYKNVETHIRQGGSVKKLGETLSWI